MDTYNDIGHESWQSYNIERNNGYGAGMGSDSRGGGWGDSHDGDNCGGGRGDDPVTPNQLVRTDPETGDLRQLVTNTVAFAHLWR